MPERQPPDLAALQAPRAAGLRLLRLAGAPQALGRLAALARWPTSAGFEPLAAMNGGSAVDAAGPDSSHTPSGDAAPPTRGARRPAPRVLNTAPGPQATPGLPPESALAATSSTPVASGTAPASSSASAPAERPARLPDPREVVAVMEALLQRPRQRTSPPALRPTQAETAPLAPLPAAQSAAALLGALVVTTQRRNAGGLGMPPRSAPQAVPPPQAAHAIGREQAVLAALQAAAAAPPVLDPLGTLRRQRPEGPQAPQSAALPSRRSDMLAPSELAPRATSRLLQAAPASAPSRQHPEPQTPDADGDELLDAITRGLVDQAWLRGVNLG